MTSTALVIGASGSIGSRILDHLEGEGWRVFSVGRQKPSTDNQLAWDLVFSNEVPAMMEVGLLVNCASPNREWASKNPQDFISWMKRHGKSLSRLREFCGSPLAYSMSTVHVYGDHQVGIIDEDSPLQGQHPYARGHLALEREIISNGWQVMRLSNTFGIAGSFGRLDTSAVTNDLTEQIARTGAAEELADKAAVRDFLPIQTLMRVFSQTILASETREVTNICSGRSVSVHNWRDFLYAVSKEGIDGETAFPSSNDSLAAKYSSLLGPISLGDLTQDAKLEIDSLLSHFRGKHGRS